MRFFIDLLNPPTNNFITSSGWPTTGCSSKNARWIRFIVMSVRGSALSRLLRLRPILPVKKWCLLQAGSPLLKTHLMSDQNFALHSTELHLSVRQNGGWLRSYIIDQRSHSNKDFPLAGLKQPNPFRTLAPLLRSRQKIIARRNFRRRAQTRDADHCQVFTRVENNPLSIVRNHHPQLARS